MTLSVHECLCCSWLHAGLYCTAPRFFTRFVFYSERPYFPEYSKMHLCIIEGNEWVRKEFVSDISKTLPPSSTALMLNKGTINYEMDLFSRSEKLLPRKINLLKIRVKYIPVWTAHHNSNPFHPPLIRTSSILSYYITSYQSFYKGHHGISNYYIVQDIMEYLYQK